MREVMTDNARERELYMGETKEICEESGIQLNTSGPLQPRIERGSRADDWGTHQRSAAMLHDSGLPKFLWAEAFSAATYVHNIRSQQNADEGYAV